MLGWQRLLRCEISRYDKWAKPYNYIYEQLVKSEDDIAGIISYSVYKRQKIKFVHDYKKKMEKILKKAISSPSCVFRHHHSS